MKKSRYASVSSVLALLVAFVSTGEEVCAQSLVQTHFVRATKYHKTDPQCDSWTLRGQTSTQLRLPKDDRFVKDPKHIGNVAVDPRHVPEGSLVFETQTKRFFVSTTGGTAVIDRRSAISIAQMRGLGPQYSNALVFDFYFPYEIVDNHFTECIVIAHQGSSFRKLKRVYQEKRLTPKFWISRIEDLYDQSKNEDEKRALRMLIAQLQK